MLLDSSVFTFRHGQEAFLMHVPCSALSSSAITLFHPQHFVDKQTVVNRHSQDAILNCDTARDKLAASDLCQQYWRFIFVWSVQYSLCGGAGSQFGGQEKAVAKLRHLVVSCVQPLKCQNHRRTFFFFTVVETVLISFSEPSFNAPRVGLKGTQACRCSCYIL